MRGDIPAPALRLLNALPVTTHTRPEEPGKRYVPLPIPHGMNNAAPIRYKGKRYDSIAEAKRQLRCGYKAIQRWLDNGDAELV
jgi:hypothetical protein